MLVPLNLFSRRMAAIVVFGEGGTGHDEAEETGTDISEFPNGLELASACVEEIMWGAEGVNGSFGSTGVPMGDDVNWQFIGFGDACGVIASGLKSVGAWYVFGGWSKCTFADNGVWR